MQPARSAGVCALDRQIVYVGAVPLDTDQLLQSRNTMVALGYFAKLTIGDDTAYADGLGCTPGSGLSIVIGPGSMTLPTVIDAGSYGALPPDGDALVKLGINTTATIVALPGVGQTIISAIVVETQAGSAAVSYYNATNPAQTLVGSGGNGQAQATVVQQRIAFASTSAAAVPAGYTPLWQISVPATASSVDSTMIALASGAPFITVKLPQAAPLLSPGLVGNPTAPTAAIGNASSTLATTAFVASATTRNRTAWGTGGTYAWTCPVGVSTVLLRIWAAGGTGGSAGSSYPGGGGGGGGYEEVLVSVVGGTSYAIQVGAASNGTTSSSFGSQVVISGGANGLPGQSGQGGTGGAAGVPATNNFSSVASVGVGPGQTGFQISSFNVGGAGGPSFGVQGAAACFGGANGSIGLWPGGGGAGGASGTGGKGADGLIIVEWNG